MAGEVIHIVRDGVELGRFDRTQARELLVTGLLLPNDRFWTTDPGATRPLSELDAPASQAEAVAQKITQSVLSAAATLRHKAGDVASRMTAAAGIQPEDLDAAKNRLLEDFLPRLQAAVGAALQKTSRTVDSVLHDEPSLRKVFGAAYDVIPRPIQRFVSERGFIEFCLRNRDRLLGKNPGAASSAPPPTNASTE